MVYNRLEEAMYDSVGTTVWLQKGSLNIVNVEVNND